VINCVRLPPNTRLTLPRFAPAYGPVARRPRRANWRKCQPAAQNRGCSRSAQLSNRDQAECSNENAKDIVAASPGFGLTGGYRTRLTPEREADRGPRRKGLRHGRGRFPIRSSKSPKQHSGPHWLQCWKVGRALSAWCSSSTSRGQLTRRCRGAVAFKTANAVILRGGKRRFIEQPPCTSFV